MTQQYLALFVVSFLFTQNANGQIKFELPPAAANRVTAQLSSPRNYELLKPISSKTSKVDTNKMLRPKNRFEPVKPLTKGDQVKAPAPPAANGMLSPLIKTTKPPTTTAAANQTSDALEKAASVITKTTTGTVTTESTSPTMVASLPAVPTTAAQPTIPSPVATEASPQADSIEITRHSFESGDFDKYAFKISNPSSTTLRKAKVMLKAPAGSSFVHVTPKPKSVDGENIVFAIGELAPNTFQIVEILIENPRNELARFQTSIVSQQFRGSAEVRYKNEFQPDRQANLELMPEVPTTSTVATARRVIENQGRAMDDVLQAEVSSANDNASENHVESFADLTPETASESEQLGGVVSLLSGPTNVVVGEEVEFSLSLTNETQTQAGDLIVQLSIPEDFKVTVLDRAAWYDADSRKISWQVPAIEAQKVETIRYKAVAKTAGLVKQGVVVGMGSTLQGTCSFKTVVR